MSRTAIIYYEYKQKGETDWKLFAPLVKKSELYLNYHELLKPNVVINGEEYVYSFQDDIQGTIRDYCDDDDQDFYRRGFPNDMSTELKTYLDREKNNGGLDGTWSHSWVTIDEFISAIEKDKLRNLKQIEEYTAKSDFTKLNDKVDKIIQYLYNKNNEPINLLTQTHSDNGGNYNDFIDYIAEYEEENDCLDYAKEYLEGIKQTIAFALNGWNDSFDIRLVYFIC